MSLSACGKFFYFVFRGARQFVTYRDGASARAAWCLGHGESPVSHEGWECDPRVRRAVRVRFSIIAEAGIPFASLPGGLPEGTQAPWGARGLFAGCSRVKSCSVFRRRRGLFLCPYRGADWGGLAGFPPDFGGIEGGGLRIAAPFQEGGLRTTRPTWLNS